MMLSRGFCALLDDADASIIYTRFRLVIQPYAAPAQGGAGTSPGKVWYLKGLTYSQWVSE